MGLAVHVFPWGEKRNSVSQVAAGGKYTRIFFLTFWKVRSDAQGKNLMPIKAKAIIAAAAKAGIIQSLMLIELAARSI